MPEGAKGTDAQDSSYTVLFDVGGMFVDAYPDPHAIAELFGDGPRCLTTLVDRAIWTHRGEYDARMSGREFWDHIAGDRGQPKPSSALLKELVALDVSRIATVDEETLDLVRRLRRQAVRLGILSNAPYPIAKAIRRSKWGNLFGFFAFSYDYGVCRPSRGICRDVPVRLNVPHEDTAFIDDRRVNVRAAELPGVQNIAWQGVEGAETRLKELGAFRR